MLGREHLFIKYFIIHYIYAKKYTNIENPTR